MADTQTGEKWSKLSLETILSYAERFDADRGKFIRIGSLVITGPFSAINARARLTHFQLYEAAAESPELAEQMATEVSMSQTAKMPTLRDSDLRNAPTNLNDAGYFSVNHFAELDSEWHQTYPGHDDGYLVLVDDISTTYGSASETGRQYTGEVFQAALGAMVLVQVSLW